jgi:uncharacterized membrane protein YjjP (DUF1212 family)
MGKAFDATGSYQTLLSRLALFTLAAASMMLLLPRYRVTAGTEDLAIDTLPASAGD